MSARAVRLTGPGRLILEHIAAATECPVFVFRDPAGPIGNGVDRRAYERLRRDGLVELGTYVAGEGRPLLLTQAGRAALDAPLQTPRPDPLPPSWRNARAYRYRADRPSA